MRKYIATSLCLVAVTACAVAPGGSDGFIELEEGSANPAGSDASLDSSAAREKSLNLLKERNGTLLFNADARLLDSNRTLRGYAASVYIPEEGCSGAMIGPNTFMSAAHCAGGDREIRFMVSRGDRYSGWKTESFECKALMRTMKDTDLMLWYCPDKDGVSPGVKYGYLDFETALTTSRKLDVQASLDRAVVDKPVRVFWWNWLDQDDQGNEIDVSKAIFVSEGKVTSRSSQSGWPAIQGDCSSDDPAPVMKTNTWVKSGVSGSSTLSAQNRILGGPTTLATGSNNGDDSLTTNAIVDYLTRANIYSPFGEASCDDRKQLNKANIEALGLVPDDYAGSVDENGDGLFDIHQDLEKKMREPAMDQVWSGLESARRNVQWFVVKGTPKFSISATDENAGSVVLDKDVTIEKPVSTKAGVAYDLAVKLSTAANGSKITLCYNEYASQCKTFTTDAGSTTLHYSITTSSGNGFVRLVGGGHTVKEVALVRPGRNVDFLTHDSRMMWRKSGNANGLYLPLGEDTTTDFIDFALVSEKGQRVRADYFPVSDGQRVCFDQRKDSRLDPEAGRGTIIVAGLSFWYDPTEDWVRLCTKPLSIPEGTTYSVAFDNANGSVLIDNVRAQ
jgi:hypothetical protein